MASNKYEALRASGERPLVIARVGDPLIDDFRDCMSKVGGDKGGFRGLVLSLRGGTQRHKLTMAELSEGLREYGLAYRVENLERVFRHLDREKTGQVSVTDFIRTVRPAMPMSRRDFVIQGYTALERCLDGRVLMKDVLQLYDCAHHPEVLAGRLTAEQVYTEFAAGWDVPPDAPLTKEEFLEYYNDLSSSIESDDYFELMLRNGWHLSGGQGIAQNTSCFRVNVKFVDGRKAVVEVKNDLGIDRGNVSEIRKRLEKQGVHHIAEVVL